MRAAAKRGILYSVLALAVATAAFMNRHADTNDVTISEARTPLTKNAVSPTERFSGAGTATKPISEPLHLQNRTPMEPSTADPFPVKTWTATTTAAPVSAQAKEAPTTPPLPFSYAGKLEEDDGRWVVYLVKGETSFNVHKGETFDDVYRLNSIGASQLEIEYLPLGTKQTLAAATDPQ